MSVSINFGILAVSIGAVLISQLNSAPLPAPASKQVNSRQATAASSKVPLKERPFWRNAQAFVDAYAKRDSVAIGQLFTKNAEFFDEFGERTVGRDAIVKMFQEVFKTTPDALVDEINIERVRFITDKVALEEASLPLRNIPVGLVRSADTLLYTSRNETGCGGLIR